MEKYQCGIFGVRLAELRQKKKLTQSELAEKLEMQRVTIAKYETGQRAPSIDNLISFSKFFQVSTDYLLGLSDNATTDTDLKAVCDYTGLSEEAINVLKDILSEDSLDNLDSFCLVDNSTRKEVINSFITEGSFYGLTECLANLYNTTKKYLSEIESNSSSSKIKALNTICDFDRYTINQTVEFISNIYDNRIAEELKAISIESLTKNINDFIEFVKEAPGNGEHNPKKE